MDERTQTFTLHRFELGVDRFITGDRFVAGTEYALTMERMALEDAVRMHLRAFLCSSEPEVVEKSWPVDWWQAFKQRWFPAWAKARWPVRWECVRMERRGIYPEIPWEQSRLRAMPVLMMRQWSEP